MQPSSPLLAENLVADIRIESPPFSTSLTDDEDEKDQDELKASVDISLSDHDYMKKVEEHVFSPSTPKAVAGKEEEGTVEGDVDELPPPVFDYTDHLTQPAIRHVEGDVKTNGEAMGTASNRVEDSFKENGDYRQKRAEEQNAIVQENPATQITLPQEDNEEEYLEEDDPFDDEAVEVDAFDSRGSFDDSSEEGVEGSSTWTEESGIEWVKHLGVFSYRAERSRLPIAVTTETSPLPYTALIQQLQVRHSYSAFLVPCLLCYSVTSACHTGALVQHVCKHTAEGFCTH